MMKKDRYMTSIVLAAALLNISAGVEADELLERENAAKNASMTLIKNLGKELKQELKKNGPASAIKVCRDVAPRINSEISRMNGWMVTRVSDKPRNPMLGMTDAWEADVLDQFRTRAEKDEDYADMTHGEVVMQDGKQYYRFMKPIPVAQVCTMCHGNPEQIPADVKANLAMDYPHDRATGYEPGDLRGAVSIKQPMFIPLSTSWSTHPALPETMSGK